MTPLSTISTADPRLFFVFLFHSATELPLRRKFPSKRIFWQMKGKKRGNEIWEKIGRKLDHFEGKGKEMLQFKLFPVISSNLIMVKHFIITF